MDKSYYDQVQAFYDRKAESYDRKYKDDTICHIHTGLFNENDLDYFRNNLSNLNPSEIQGLLWKGQREIFNLLQQRCISEGEHLDVGAGHGGNAISLATSIGAKVEAVTISPVQIQIINSRIKAAKVDHLVNTKFSNILDFSSPKRYDVAFGVESFCQIKDLDLLLKKMHDLLKENGSLIIIDYFTEDSAFKEFFDRYWCCSIHSREEFKKQLKLNGLALVEDIDLTLNQAPFWDMSAHHSRLLSIEAEVDEKEKNRLIRSEEFHKFMFQKFLNREAEYRLIKAVRI